MIPIRDCPRISAFTTQTECGFLAWSYLKSQPQRVQRPDFKSACSGMALCSRCPTAEGSPLETLQEAARQVGQMAGITAAQLERLERCAGRHRRQRTCRKLGGDRTACQTG